MGDETQTSKPIWHSPAWVTAIVGVISAFLTVPDVVGNFLAQQQAVKLAEEQTKAQRLLNEGSKQDQELNVLRETLAQPSGLERVFVLRYLSRTLDDEDARKWAEDEVARLERIAQAEEEQQQTDAALRELQGDIDSQTGDAGSAALDQLRKDLDRQTAELQRLLREAGVSVQSLATVPALATEAGRDLSRVILVPTDDVSLEQLRSFAKGIGWSDIGMHYIVRPDGQVEIGRALNRTPAVAAGNNKGSVGIGVACPGINTFDLDTFCTSTPAQFEALVSLVEALMQENDIAFDQVFDTQELPMKSPKRDYLGDLTERVRAELENRLAP